ncbi:hypothetical protein [Geminocystis sp. GBBB08]|uniref:hypothetical protein n=1 Tax=Geminocystis sp. GBBB08 TaxID=2604140 RepID=UPI0027E2C5DB|nr:hypothetical protein [Geminocystis sp. GBBB08]MBL1208268.1 hypothetical protein [Geminocystis sp. GBBB08]
MYKDFEVDLIELEDVIINGYFIGENSEYYIFQEIEFTASPYKLLDVWHIDKSTVKGIPKENIQGILQLDDSYYPEFEGGKWYISKGMGALMNFISNPFL